MHTSPPPQASILALSPDALLEHSGWMRRLVHQLVRDASQVDDLVQDAWAAALQNPPPEGLPLRAWLSGIVKRTALARGRTTQRRRQREEDRTLDDARAGKGVAPSVAELSACADEQRFLLEAIGDLPEELKAVLLLRFYSDLPPRKIAAELGIPVNTVRTRQRTGVERLRERLERRHDGDSSAWAMALLPLAGGLPISKAAAKAGAAGSAGWTLAGTLRGAALAAAVTAVGVASWWYLTADHVPDLSQHTGGQGALATVAAVLERPDRSPEVDSIVPAPGESSRVAASAPLQFHAIAVDEQGSPVPDVGIDRGYRPQPNHSYGYGRADWMPSWLTTDSEGKASTRAKSPDAELYVRAHHPGYLQTAQVTQLRPGEVVPIEMVRTATTTLEVEVIDPESGLACATFHALAFQYQDQFAEGISLNSVLNEDMGTSDGRLSMNKRFAVDRPIHVHLMSVPGPWFGADKQSYRAEVVGVEGGITRVRFEVDLDRPETSGSYPVARGAVVDAETGAPIAGAVLRTKAELDTGDLDDSGEQLAQQRTVGSYGDGSFALAIQRGSISASVSVGHPEYVPIEAKVTTDPVSGGTTIRMQRRGVLHGRIVDKNDAPVSGAPLLIFAQESGQSMNDARRTRMLADEEGRFEVPRLLAGRVWVYVLKKPRDADENALRSESFRVKNGASRDVVIRMSRPERVHVTGEVQSTTRKKIAHVPVFLPYAEEQGWTIAKATRYGFDAGGVERGRYLVALVPEEDGDTSGPLALLPDVEVTGLGAQRFEFAFPAARLSGVVTIAPGLAANLADLRVLAVPADLRGVAHEFTSAAKAAKSFGVAVDAESGAFELEHLTNGDHRLEIWRTSATTGQLEKLATREVTVSGSTRLGPWEISAEARPL